MRKSRKRFRQMMVEIGSQHVFRSAALATMMTCASSFGSCTGFDLPVMHLAARLLQWNLSQLALSSAFCESLARELLRRSRCDL